MRRLFDFDALGSAPLSSQDFSYDPNGNRLSFTEGASYAYTVTPNTNRVTSVAGPVPKTYTYDAAGNITNDGTTTYTYDDRGRLVTAGTATYTYNGLGQRVKKDNGAVTLFAYDEEGNLIGEYDSAGNPIREHVWFDGAPVAVIVGTDVHYVHTDHLGTPRAITDAGTVIWRWESDPFGSTAAQEDPDGDLNTFTYNLRFPGQYYDSESGLHYNYFRTYDPSTGRYLESDPIGLQGGPNTYMYVANNPLILIDPLGLNPWEEDWMLEQRFERDINTSFLGELLAEEFTPYGTARDSIDFCENPSLLNAAGFIPFAGGILKRLPNSAVPDSADARRVAEQRQRRAERREQRSRQGPDGARDQAGNPQKQSGDGYRDHDNANRGPQGRRPSGPDRRHNRERNIGIDEEHSMRPKGGVRNR